MIDPLGPPGKEAGGRLYTTPPTGYLSTRPRICGRADSGKHPAPTTVVSCPDCAVSTSGWDLVHSPTCRLGRQSEATSREDARWFRLHPGKDERRRPVRPDEIALLRLFGDIPDDTEVRGMVGVRQIGDGLRAKVFDGLTITARGGAR